MLAWLQNLHSNIRNGHVFSWLDNRYAAFSYHKSSFCWFHSVPFNLLSRALLPMTLHLLSFHSFPTGIRTFYVELRTLCIVSLLLGHLPSLSHHPSFSSDFSIRVFLTTVSALIWPLGHSWCKCFVRWPRVTVSPQFGMHSTPTNSHPSLSESR